MLACARRMRLLPVPLLVAASLLLAACGSDAEPERGGSSSSPPAASTPSDSEAPAGGSGERVETAKGEAVLFSGDGGYGVVLAHGAAFDAASWSAQAAKISAAGTTALAVEDISPEGIEAAVTYLKEEKGIQDVALMGASAGADGTLALATQKPDLPYQLILLSANRVVDASARSPSSSSRARAIRSSTSPWSSARRQRATRTRPPSSTAPSTPRRSSRARTVARCSRASSTGWPGSPSRRGF